MDNLNLQPFDLTSPEVSSRQKVKREPEVYQENGETIACTEIWRRFSFLGRFPDYRIYINALFSM